MVHDGNNLQDSIFLFSNLGAAQTKWLTVGNVVGWLYENCAASIVSSVSRNRSMYVNGVQRFCFNDWTKARFNIKLYY